LTNFLKNNRIYSIILITIKHYNMPKQFGDPNDDLENQEDENSSESYEDLVDDEYEDNLDEYGDGNEEVAWKKSADDDDDEYEDDEI